MDKILNKVGFDRKRFVYCNHLVFDRSGLKKVGSGVGDTFYKLVDSTFSKDFNIEILHLFSSKYNV